MERPGLGQLFEAFPGVHHRMQYFRAIGTRALHCVWAVHGQMTWVRHVVGYYSGRHSKICIGSFGQGLISFFFLPTGVLVL
jgi:hypothetical protein